ncbi:MAG: hypothetical protein ACRC1T_16835 [Clostridium chrysemydis]|uniref:hypothetical protein n=1 Tax=Clostridium chrysemydis TaxID=2665504 RepID=UPI003F3FD64D
MKYKKKQGSSLVLVIGIVAILVVLLGIVSKAILSTTRLNQTTKDSEDLIYAAESGIEIGVSRIIKNKKINSNWEPTAENDKKIIVSESEFNSNSISIYAEIERLKDSNGNIKQNHYLIESTGTNSKGKSKTVKATFGQNYGSESIFKNVLCADSVTMSGGSINADPSPINIRDKDNITGGTVGKTVTNYAFTLPEFNFEKLKDTDKNAVVKDVNEMLSYLNSKIGQGVVKIELDLSHPYSGKYPVYLLNSDTINFKFKDATSQGEKFIVMSNGDINFDFENRGTINLSRASIIGKSLNLGSNGAITFNFAPQGPDANHPLKESDIRKLNLEIAKYASNWENNSDVGGSGTDYWGTIEYEY